MTPNALKDCAADIAALAFLLVGVPAFLVVLSAFVR